MNKKIDLNIVELMVNYSQLVREKKSRSNEGRLVFLSNNSGHSLGTVLSGVCLALAVCSRYLFQLTTLVVAELVFFSFWASKKESEQKMPRRASMPRIESLILFSMGDTDMERIF